MAPAVAERSELVRRLSRVESGHQRAVRIFGHARLEVALGRRGQATEDLACNRRAIEEPCQGSPDPNVVERGAPAVPDHEVVAQVSRVVAMQPEPRRKFPVRREHLLDVGSRLGQEPVDLTGAGGGQACGLLDDEAELQTSKIPRFRIRGASPRVGVTDQVEVAAREPAARPEHDVLLGVRAGPGTAPHDVREACEERFAPRQLAGRVDEELPLRDPHVGTEGERGLGAWLARREADGPVIDDFGRLEIGQRERHLAPGREARIAGSLQRELQVVAGHRAAVRESEVIAKPVGHRASVLGDRPGRGGRRAHGSVRRVEFDQRVVSERQHVAGRDLVPRREGIDRRWLGRRRSEHVALRAGAVDGQRLDREAGAPVAPGDEQQERSGRGQRSGGQESG